MRKIERAALRTKTWSWAQLQESFSPAMAPVGLTPGDGDVSVALLDLGDDGRVAIFDDGALARRAGLALAAKIGAPVDVFEVLGTAGPKRFRFRTTAWRATPEGDLKSIEGQEVNLEDPEAWTGDFAEQADQVLSAFARFESSTRESARCDFVRRKGGKASTPRVATLLSALREAKRHELLPQPDGRFELRIELAKGGVQRSFCSADEAEELKRLLER